MLIEKVTRVQAVGATFPTEGGSASGGRSPAKMLRSRCRPEWAGGLKASPTSTTAWEWNI